jgi:hypothetical protein
MFSLERFSEIVANPNRRAYEKRRENPLSDPFLLAHL